MAAPRFFTLLRSITLLSIAVLLTTAVIASKPASWVVVFLLAAALLLDTVRIWRLETQLHHQRQAANYYADALRGINKELDRG